MACLSRVQLLAANYAESKNTVCRICAAKIVRGMTGFFSVARVVLYTQKRLNWNYNTC